MPYNIGPVCPLCDEPYEPTDRDLPEGFCDPCAEGIYGETPYEGLPKSVRDLLGLTLVDIL
jgi:hypothetical protein